MKQVPPKETMMRDKRRRSLEGYREKSRWRLKIFY
jgi:hypothetical protein